MMIVMSSVANKSGGGGCGDGGGSNGDGCE